jgi:hypothetical protein
LWGIIKFLVVIVLVCVVLVFIGKDAKWDIGVKFKIQKFEKLKKDNVGLMCVRRNRWE